MTGRSLTLQVFDVTACQFFMQQPLTHYWRRVQELLQGFSTGLLMLFGDGLRQTQSPKTPAHLVARFVTSHCYRLFGCQGSEWTVDSLILDALTVFVCQTICSSLLQPQP